MRKRQSRWQTARAHPLEAYFYPYLESWSSERQLASRFGDARLCVGALSTLAEGASPPKTARFACAAHATTSVGAQPSLPTRDKVEKFLASRKVI